VAMFNSRCSKKLKTSMFSVILGVEILIFFSVIFGIEILLLKQ
jgi:hypothetical protein